ncbi:MAG: hypothetical protein QOG49_661 [Frankiaceae bacterium]|nr:hypothetical protein [Frankiaceae bacterium]
MTLLGRNRLPDDATRLVFGESPLLPGERLLQWAASGAGWVVATTVGLRWPSAYLLVRWDEINHVSYAAGAMTVEPPGTRLEFDDVRRLPEVVRERVNSSIALDRHVRLTSEGKGMRVIGRRRSDTGELRWETTYDDGVDRDDPLVARRAAAAVDEVQSLFG